LSSFVGGGGGTRALGVVRGLASTGGVWRGGGRRRRRRRRRRGGFECF